ncbi:AbrB/MazE/SpoVT family DNA-binding domain-containing protein [Sutcliffiella rhizosphaerae]|uniref:SpoVT-AbrB domain-containing protein n=1 Tax=Sutcliffiella rhizosphaerae TaxID=2880967 RepID=A0ABM8YSB5_9BACI|nr:AbrB/MazE/SpoVT family DNA-binding domain-containing protein [Sutcliffiella rhizosphaerae]CAG9622791.1 hypothetical protein BACCIP111883_03582 [Sutcliffiella rhizosphaerae]
MAVKALERKVTKVGNSLGITLPQEALEHAKAKQGDELKFTLNDDGSITLKKYQPLQLDVLEDMDIDQEFLEGMKDLVDNYDNTLRNLVNR